ncbi:MAG TPA: GIY-YIG nuclease family protein [Gammaproteobacteria bacterium]|nr:GIY-YIG nuclease family protein [Gammaproteobacteria bacterium]
MESTQRQLQRSIAAAALSHVHDDLGAAAGGTALYTLADPRDLRAPRYVGQTRAPRRRFAQHVRTARLWLRDETPWWVRSPKYRPLYEWIRALHRDEGRLPFMWVVDWLEPTADARMAERAAIMRLLAQGAALLNVEARLLGGQLPLL